MGWKSREQLEQLDVLERRAISVGLENGDQVEVISGVSAGERVVVSGPQTLKDGDKVKVQ